MECMGIEIKENNWQYVKVRGMNAITLRNFHSLLKKADGNRTVTLSVPFGTLADDVPKAFKCLEKDIRAISNASLFYESQQGDISLTMNFIEGFIADKLHKEFTVFLSWFGLPQYEEMMAHQDIINWVKK